MLKSIHKIFLVLFLVNFLNQCQAQKNEPMNKEHTNALIHETSPYLLQHAHNPVDWMPWGEEALEKAKKENKLVIISIGYSACHWCHVMERESFEDSASAALMNEHYVSIKIDREERPDVDQIYMTAVQLMTQRGGWPLNVVTLPDGRPVWGGTYFPKANWMQALQSIHEFYVNEPDKMLEYAEKLTAGIVQSELIKVNDSEPSFQKNEADTIFNNWKMSFDEINGGPNRAPKFPLPNNYEYLLQYGHLANDSEALEHVQLTLMKMSFGGIYDQIGGGFARYSTDEVWKAPHFEKMLYDNAQLVSLYSKAYQKFKKPLYKETVLETLEWIAREMTGKQGEFYSALDADSEGEEGKFYVWKEEELKQLIPGSDWIDFKDYYNINQKGLWEHGNYILLRDSEDFEVEEEKVEAWKTKLLRARSERIRPGLDDKSLTSWNAMMITAYLDAYAVFENPSYLKAAETNAHWLVENQVKKDGSLVHSYKAGESKIEGLLEDYAFSIQAFLKLFEVTGKEKYLSQAKEWMNFCQANFKDEESQLFFTRNLNSTQLIAKSLETADNVIPASNSVMANNLFMLSHYLDNPNYMQQCEIMLNQVKERMLQYGENYSNWGQLHLNFTYPFYEVAINGKGAQNKYLDFQKDYQPNALWIHSETESNLALLENRYPMGEALIYVCQNKVCQLPVENVTEASKLIQ